jgi:hypothetical protein
MRSIVVHAAHSHAVSGSAALTVTQTALCTRMHTGWLQIQSRSSMLRSGLAEHGSAFQVLPTVRIVASHTS